MSDDATALERADAVAIKLHQGKKLALAKRLADACKLRSDGVSWPDIAERLGTDERNLRRDVDAYIASVPSESLALLRIIHGAQLDQQRRDLLSLLERAQATEEASKDSVAKSKSQQAQAQIHARLLSVNESQRKLNGADAPIKQELTTWVGTVDPAEAARLVRDGFPNGAARTELRGEVIESRQLTGPSDSAGSEAVPGSPD
jgi:hypothetical protein